MLLLIAGLALWIGAHLFKRLAVGPRQALGDKGKGLVAALVLGGVVLMVLGYRAAPVEPVWSPLPGMGHLNNLLMLIAVYFMGLTPTKGVLADKIRHPMLWGVVIWGVAHLLVNGDQVSLLLFGTLILWSLVTMMLINREEEAWQRPAAGTLMGDARNLVGTLVIFGVVTWIHTLLGHSPFLGTYG